MTAKPRQSPHGVASLMSLALAASLFGGCVLEAQDPEAEPVDALQQGGEEWSDDAVDEPGKSEDDRVGAEDEPDWAVVQEERPATWLRAGPTTDPWGPTPDPWHQVNPARAEPIQDGD